MFRSGPQAIAPDIPIHTPSAGASHYVQERTALFAKVALACSTAGLAVRAFVDVIKGHPDRIVGASYVFFGVMSVAMLGLWLLTRGKSRPPLVVRMVELVAISGGMLAASFAFRLSTPGLLSSSVAFGPAHPNFMQAADSGLFRVLFEYAGLMLSLLVGTQLLAVRAALVPSTLRYTLLLAAVVGLPICVCTGLGWPSSVGADVPIAKEDRGFLIVFGMNWWLFTGAASGVIARVVHRLQSEVQVAQRLGQYEVGEKLGEGGMGVVYRARHAMMKRPVAIKLLPPEAAGQVAIARFEREVQLTSQLSHPNTVVVHDYGRTHDGVFYYVMELIEGATLEQVSLACGKMPSGRVVHILTMVAGALGEAHDHGLVHRDVKPANILLGPRGGEPDVAKVLDFGLVRAVRGPNNVTHADMMVGTPLFMSPEAIRNPDRVDARSDLYSLGAVAYFLLAGRPVFDGETAVDICAQHMHATPRPLSQLVPDVDPELEKLVTSCLAKDPAARPASARALCDALARCPSRNDWTPAKAREWWAIHDRLIHPIAPSKTFATTDAADLAVQQGQS